MSEGVQWWPELFIALGSVLEEMYCTVGCHALFVEDATDISRN